MLIRIVDNFSIGCLKAHRGIKGFVKDHNGKPIKGASISIGDRRHDILSAIDGDFWRLLVPGTYDVTVRAKGLKPTTKSVEVSPGYATMVNFTLQPKQIDGLEEALGHVNRVCFDLRITSDVVFNLDSNRSQGTAHFGETARGGCSEFLQSQLNLSCKYHSKITP